MKKTLMIFALTGVVALTSCDPQKAEGDFYSTTQTAETLLNGATFKQYDAVKNDDGTISYVESADGNYIEYDFPDLSAITAYYINKKGEQKTLAYGKCAGMMYYMPARGSDPVQPVYFSYVNADGTEVVAEKQFTLKVAQELTPEMKVLVSNAGEKKWRWMPTNVNGGAVWGNGGCLQGAQDGSLDIAGAWWGCGVLDGDCGDTFEGQTQHAGSRWPEVKGECYALSYMKFTEDGAIIAYSNENVVINEGNFTIKDWNNNEITNADRNSRGILETSAGAILWPFQINGNGFQPTSFDIGYLDPSRMILIYPSEGTENWRECTWWSFMSDDDPAGILASHDWHWRPTNVNGGAVWGNGGCLQGSQDGTDNINGGWWGCGVNDGDCPNTFADQMGHAGPAYMEGEEYSTSRMVFNEDEGSITIYGKDGNKLREGTFEIDWTPNPEEFSLGTLKTSAGAILWPFQINGNGFQPTNFNVGYLGGNALILIYPSEGTENWRECTWWSFGK